MEKLTGLKMKNNIIRKITIGKDYKNDSMHYAVDQEVYGGHKICDIVEEEDKYCIYIKKEIWLYQLSIT